MQQKKLTQIFNKNLIKYALGPFLIILSSILFTFYSGYRGVFPIDSFLIYDSGYKIINGHLPFKDYWSVTGPLLDYLQFLFFKIFGINWFSYVLHASLINLFISLLFYYFLIQLNLSRIFSFLYSISISILAYPSAGTPFADHHATIISFASIMILILAITKENKIYWVLLPIFLIFSFLSKQIPSSYLFFLFLITIIFNCYLNNNKNLKNILLILSTSAFILIFLILLMLYINKIPLKNIWIQYFLFPIEIGESRFNSINFDFKKVVLNFKFIYFSLFPLIFVLFKILYISNKNLKQKKDILCTFFLIFSVLIFIYCQVLTKNQILIFFTIPFILGYTHYLSNKYNLTNLIYTILISILLISTIKFHERFNINKKFMDLDKADFKLSQNSEILDQSLKNLKWITPIYPTKPNYELNKLIELKETLINDPENKIIVTNYQFLPSITNLKKIAPNKWFDGQSVPKSNSKYFNFYKNFLINSLKNQEVKIIYLTFNKVIYFNEFFEKDCYETTIVNEISSRINIAKCLKN